MVHVRRRNTVKGREGIEHKVSEVNVNGNWVANTVPFQTSLVLV